MRVFPMLRVMAIQVVSVLLLTCGIGIGKASTPAISPHKTPPPRVIALTGSDGIHLKATYYSAGKPGPGVLLIHQVNRTRKSWDGVAARLAAAGINVLTLDMRGHGDSGGTAWNKLSRNEQGKHWRGWPEDVETGLQYLASHPGVDKDRIGLGGAGLLGVDNGVEAARRHPGLIKSFVLISGETFRDGLQFLHKSPGIPGLYVVSDDDEYPPTREAMELLYASDSSPYKRFVHYAATHDAPWLWYEPYNLGRVPDGGEHGTDLFQNHPKLPGMIVNWFVTTLVQTPGRAPVDGITASSILNKLEWEGGATEVTRQLRQARKVDPNAQLFPEVTVSIIGLDFMRVGDVKSAIGIFKLNLFAYPDSADALANLAGAYVRAGQPDLAMPLAEKALEITDDPERPVSSWSNTREQRGEIRKYMEATLRKLGEVPPVPHAPGAVFHDCQDCPEMVVVPAGQFEMGSSAKEKAWAATHGSKAAWVADEAPLHNVSLHAFALGRYDVTRAQYATFVRETGRSDGDGCGRNSFKLDKQPDLSWRNPGFGQTDVDPVVCVSWQDAKAYIAWLNSKLKKSRSSTGAGLYRLPTEAEWEYAARSGTTSKFWWGEDAHAAPDYAWYKDNAGGSTHPVGTRPANAFGLFDIVGDVWQWTEDCYVKSYSGAPTDGSAVEAGKDCLRVDRGGSWLYPAWLLRSATRERNPADFRDVIMGFRVARNLP